MTVEEKMAELKRRKEEQIFDDTTVDLAFEIIKDHPDDKEKCRAAVILSGIVERGLGARTKKFLEDNRSLPDRVQQLLGSAIMRMEGY